MRKTKIVATIGPVCDSEEAITDLIKAGVDVFRFNMKHGNVEWHSQRMSLVEKVCDKLGVRVAMLLDLQGPEIRIDHIPGGTRLLKQGDRFKFVPEGENDVVLDRPQIFEEVKVGQTVYADDGFLEFKIVKVGKDFMEVEVVEGGELKERKTTNFVGARLGVKALVEKDLEHLSLVARHHVDFVALSFVRRAEDMKELRGVVAKYKVDCGVVAKIEHPEAVEHFNEILAESDAIMVARGDLGIEYPMEEVPGLQKMMIRRAREEGKPIIVATQMLESMTTNVRPTRAEVSDVANAVYDGADAVMLSGETASGKYPLKAVKTMAKIVGRVDKDCDPGEIGDGVAGMDQTAILLRAATEVARWDKEVKALVVLTDSGRKARLLSRLRPCLPIVALSKKEKTVDMLKLSYGVMPMEFEYTRGERISKMKISEMLKHKGILLSGKFVLVYGNVAGDSGKTSVVRVMEV